MSHGGIKAVDRWLMDSWIYDGFMHALCRSNGFYYAASEVVLTTWRAVLLGLKRCAEPLPAALALGPII